MRLFARTAALIAAMLGSLAATPVWAAPTPHLDRLFVIVMENRGFDQVLGTLDHSGQPETTPNLTRLATTYSVALHSYGTTHPSEPNYLAMIAGDYFGVADDDDSCYASTIVRPPCHGFDAPNLIDQLESNGISWVSYNQSMPSAGYLGSSYPDRGARLYAQKHDPFVFFKDIATNPKRLQHIAAMPSMKDFAAALRDASYPRFSYIVPDQCHDMHGTTGCDDKAQREILMRQSDAYAGELVRTIVASPAFTANSAILITYDEGSDPQVVPDSPVAGGGGHIATIVVTHQALGKRSNVPLNQYSVLRTIEEAFGLPFLGNAAKVNSMSDLFH